MCEWCYSYLTILLGISDLVQFFVLRPGDRGGQDGWHLLRQYSILDQALC